MEEYLTLITGEKFTIPPLVVEALQADQNCGQSPNSWTELQEKVDELLHLPDDQLGLAANEALCFIRTYRQAEKTEYLVVSLGAYIDIRTRLEKQQNQPEDLLNLLCTVIAMEHSILSGCTPPTTRWLIGRMACQIEFAFGLCAQLGSLRVLQDCSSSTLDLMKITQNIWEPEILPYLRKSSELLKYLSSADSPESRTKRQYLGKLLGELSGVKKSLNQSPAQRPSTGLRINLLKDLLDAWQQIAQQEILLAGSVEYTSEGINYKDLSRQVQNLIGEVENRLRLLIARKYELQYKTSWQEHIQAKHVNLYNSWKRNMERDQSSFATYREYSPNILEYSSLDDLRDLITAQWHLFSAIFDFGYQERNKSVFFDKMYQITRVRNPLAHHRNIPENELLRARVLCTDILIALDSSGEEAEK
jgi:hypothetical protein